MFRRLTSLFRKEPQDSKQIIEDHVGSLTIEDFQSKVGTYEHRASVALMFLIGKQLLEMGLKLESVPACHPYTSKNCRGYLLGVAHGIMTSFNERIDPDLSELLAKSAFILVFGHTEGPKIWAQTANEFGHGSGLAHGYVRGSQEAEVIYKAEGSDIDSGTEFWFFCSQETD